MFFFLGIGFVRFDDKLRKLVLVFCGFVSVRLYGVIHQPVLYHNDAGGEANEETLVNENGKIFFR